MLANLKQLLFPAALLLLAVTATREFTFKYQQNEQEPNQAALQPFLTNRFQTWGAAENSTAKLFSNPKRTEMRPPV